MLFVIHISSYYININDTYQNADTWEWAARSDGCVDTHTHLQALWSIFVEHMYIHVGVSKHGDAPIYGHLIRV